MNVGPNHAVEKEIGKVMTAETESGMAPWSVPLGKMDKEHPAQDRSRCKWIRRPNEEHSGEKTYP